MVQIFQKLESIFKSMKLANFKKLINFVDYDIVDRIFIEANRNGEIHAIIDQKKEFIYFNPMSRNQEVTYHLNKFTENMRSIVTKLSTEEKMKAENKQKIFTKVKEKFQEEIRGIQDRKQKIKEEHKRLEQQEKDDEKNFLKKSLEEAQKREEEMQKQKYEDMRNRDIEQNLTKQKETYKLKIQGFADQLRARGILDVQAGKTSYDMNYPTQAVNDLDELRMLYHLLKKTIKNFDDNLKEKENDFITRQAKDANLQVRARRIFEKDLFVERLQHLEETENELLRDTLKANHKKDLKKKKKLDPIQEQKKAYQDKVMETRRSEHIQAYETYVEDSLKQIKEEILSKANGAKRTADNIRKTKEVQEEKKRKRE